MADYMTEAVEAAKGTGEYLAGLPFIGTADAVEVYTKAVIRAAAPIIERAVQDRVAKAIEAQRGRIETVQRENNDGYVPDVVTQILAGYTHAARIARGTA